MRLLRGESYIPQKNNSCGIAGGATAAPPLQLRKGSLIWALCYGCAIIVAHPLCFAFRLRHLRARKLF